MIILFYFNPYFNVCVISSIIIFKVMKYTRVEYDIKFFLKPIQKKEAKVKTKLKSKIIESDEEKSVSSVEYNSDCQENLLFRFKQD